MKISSKFKKVGLASLTALAGTTGLQAGSDVVLGGSSASATMGEVSDNFQNILKNVTPGVSRTNPDGSKTIGTPSIYFRFGNEFNAIEPIFHISPMEVSYGCGGFSIKGMFMTMLGLDRIQEMLKSSSQSFAYGIVVGLIYTMPGIFHSFQMINQWAKKIQDMMANACNAGKALGKELGGRMPGGKGLGGMIDNFVDKLPNPSAIVNKGLDSVNSAMSEAFGFSPSDLLSSEDNKDVSDYSTEDVDIPPEQQVELLSEIMQGIKVYNSISTSTIYSLIVEANDASRMNDFFCDNVVGTCGSGIASNSGTVGTTEGSSSLKYGEFLITYAPQGIPSVYGMQEFLTTGIGMAPTDPGILNKYMIMLKMSLQKAALGDMILTDRSNLKNVLNGLSSIVTAKANKNSGSTANDGYDTAAKKQDAAQIFKDIIKGKASLAEAAPETKNVDFKQLGRGMAQLLIGDATANVEDFNKLKNSVPPWGFSFASLPPSSLESENVDVSIFTVSGTKATAMSGGNTKSFFENVSLPTKGLYESSMEIAYELIDRDQNKTTDAILNTATGGLGSTAGGIQIPFIVPKFFIFAKIAQQSLPDDRDRAIIKLAQYNTCNVAMSAINVFKRSHIYGQGKMGFGLSVGPNVLGMSPYAGPGSAERVTSINNYMTKQRTSEWTKFYSGFEKEVTKILGEQEFSSDESEKTLARMCNVDQLEAWFRTLDYHNRRRAASTVDSAQ